MQIGEVIREQRKRKNMTQEEMANRLGVTAPAVNKWEKGNTQPDIMLLAPIARLLNITLDTLLSFEEALTPKEIINIIKEIDAKFKIEAYESVFQWAKGKIEQYPNCTQLVLQVGLILDVQCLTKDIGDSEKYEDYIQDCYMRALNSEDEDIRIKAADLLFGLYTRKEEYEKAEEYLIYFSDQNPEKKRKQAFIYSKTNRLHDAYKAYEEILFSSYNITNMVFYNIYLLAMQDENKEKAHMIIEKQCKLASLFEMGSYHEVSPELDIATAEKDVAATIEITEKMLAGINDICGFSKSSLYEHMDFKEVSEEFVDNLRKKLQTMFHDEEIYGYMKSNTLWLKLIGNPK